MELTGLETAFYTLGIIFMSLMIILMITVIVLIFYIKHKINMIQLSIENKIEDVKDKSQEVALDLGATLLSKLFGKKKK